MLFPVEMVSWDDVQVFLQKLNAREKAKGWIYRLPTEAEWEYACRGGASSEKDCSYDFYLERPSYDLSAEQANIRTSPNIRNSLGRTSQVGSFKPNRLGIYDMHGNIFEWTNTLEGKGRVIRGGSWAFFSFFCRAAYRYEDASLSRSSHLGFRLSAVPSGG
jgi:formylglycine-generating enzyme required for sulfatase activity